MWLSWVLRYLVSCVNQFAWSAPNPLDEGTLSEKSLMSNLKLLRTYWRLNLMLLWSWEQKSCWKLAVYMWMIISFILLLFICSCSSDFYIYQVSTYVGWWLTFCEVLNFKKYHRILMPYSSHSFFWCMFLQPFSMLDLIQPLSLLLSSIYC